MTIGGRNHAVNSASSEPGTAMCADARGNDQYHPASPDDQICVRAYERYIAGGMQPSDLRDWLEAERENHEGS
jgi:hypothetical protein